MCSLIDYFFDGNVYNYRETRYLVLKTQNYDEIHVKRYHQMFLIFWR